jgi:hypothetical protein
MHSMKQQFTINIKNKKMKKLLFSIVFFSAFSINAQVGIGTNTPSANAMLDVTSTNKGILLPRLNDTSSVSNPSAGLMIYNSHTKTPAFHDGSRWNAFAAIAAANADSLTYTLTGAANGFTNGTYGVLSISGGGSNSGTPAGTNFNDISFLKLADINSIPFLSNMSSSTLQSSASQAIVFNFYAAGAATPYYSIKSTNWKVSSVSNGAPSERPGLYEAISVSVFETGIIGFKDWINNKSFGYNVVTKTVVAY